MSDEEPDQEPATLDDVLGRLRVLTSDVNTLRRYTAVILIIGALQLAVIALWLFGVMTVEFKLAR